MNPGQGPAAGGGTTDPTAMPYTAGTKDMRRGNSNNHHNEGQNVLYCDGHVSWEQSCFAGVVRPGTAWRDNIYANIVNANMTTGQGGDIGGPGTKPFDYADSVLLPRDN